MFLASPALAGELTVSPTLELSYLNVDIDNEEKKENALNAFLNTDIDYINQYWESNLTHELKFYKYQEKKDSDLVMNEFNWQNNLKFFEKQLDISHKWSRYREVYDEFDGGFNDDFYSVKGDVVRNMNVVSARYTAPKHWGVSLSLGGKINDDRLIPDGPQSEKSEIKSNELDFSVSDKSTVGIFWQAQGFKRDQKKQEGMTFTQETGSAVVRMPVLYGWNATAKGSISQYQNSTPWDFGEDDRKVRTLVTGLGFGWVKIQNVSFFEATYDKVDDSDDGVSYSWGAEFGWLFADRWQLKAKKTSRFYGDSYTASLQYNTERSVFSIVRDEDVSQRYVPVPTFVNNGNYACSPDESGNYGLSPDYCHLLSNDIELGEDEIIIPDIQQQFPLEPKLTLDISTTVKWEFEKGKWEHELSLSRNEDSDLSNENSTYGHEGKFLAEYRLNKNNYLRMNWQFRDIEIKPVNHRSISRIGSIGYHQEINSKAEWSFTLKGTSQTNDGSDYKDIRLILSYQHFFGKKHNKKR